MSDALRFSDNSVYDHPSLQALFLERDSRCSASENSSDDNRQAVLIIEGISCAGCCAKIERELIGLSGVTSAELNYSTHQVRIEWQSNAIQLSHILNQIEALGYRAHPYRSVERDRSLQDERKNLLRRLGVAAALGMQVMVLAVALYSGAWWGMDNQFHNFFRGLSLLLTVPVLAYSARPFYSGAWRDLKRLRVGMDVPVSLGLSIAFIASVGSIVIGRGEVYFDSVVMFVTFLLGARYIELNGRMRAAQPMNRHQTLIPDNATRVSAGKHADQPGRYEDVPTICLEPEDLILVQAGQTVPADGDIQSGASSLDEALLTGESLPVSKKAGDRVIAGAINLEQPLHIKVTHTGAETVVSNIARLMQCAQFEKPEVSRFIDRLSGFFVTAVLTIAILVSAIGYLYGNAGWLSSTIAVLIVSCPCALALAAPTAISAALGNALHNGILITNSRALELLHKATHFFFDKTGTLTTGKLKLSDVRILTQVNKQRCLQIARSLEQFSTHPLAKVLADSIDEPALPVTQINIQTGAGVSGNIDGKRYCIGNASYLAAIASVEYDDVISTDKSIAILCDDQKALAVFSFADEVRNDAPVLTRDLKARGKHVGILSGDHDTAVEHVAKRLGIDEAYANCTPDRKLNVISAKRAPDNITAMVGDGVNDAPVIGAADVSVAMGDSVNLAAANADVVLLGNRLGNLGYALELAARTDRIMKQNLFWALTYNAVAIPFAALGYIPPWLAAIGMSLSSTIVVLNALRLAPGKTAKAETG